MDKIHVRFSISQPCLTDAVIVILNGLLSYEHPSNAQENIFLPPVQQSDGQNAQKLRQAVPAGEDRVFQTKDHQQADDCAGKHCAQVTDKRRGLFAFREEKEGEKAGGHGTQHHGRHSENLL